MFTEKGNQALQILFEQFCFIYAGNHPGCNENDLERAFLLSIFNNVTYAKSSWRHIVDCNELSKSLDLITSIK